MKNVFSKIGVLTSLLARKMKVRTGTLSILVAFFALQLYFVRELLAAELLFGLGLAALLVLGMVFYLVGAMGMRGLDLAESGVRVIADSTRRGYETLEELSRKPFRHPRSESAQ